VHPTSFFKCLADDTRLKTLLLLAVVEQACVCDLMAALELDQPKISRHLAQLRRCNIVVGERRGKWIFYQLNPQLPRWARSVIDTAARDNADFIRSPLKSFTASQASAAACS